MDAKKLISVIGLTRKIKKQQDEAQATLHKIAFALAHEHLRQNEVKQTLNDWDATKDAINLLLGFKASPSTFHRRTRSMLPTHIRAFDLKPVRVRCNRAVDLYNVYEVGHRDGPVEVLGAEELESRYISIEVEEDA
jgi:hypothetical protein